MTLTRQLDGSQRDLLLDLAVLVNERGSVAAIFAAFAQELLKVARFDFASLVAYEADRRFLKRIGAFPIDSVGDAPDRFPDRFAGVHSLKDRPDGQELDPAGSDLPVIRALSEGGLKRIWSVPLLEGDEFYGAFLVGSREPFPFPSEELAFLRVAAGLLTGAVRDESRVVHANRDAARGALLNELALLLNGGRCPGVVFERLTALMSQAIDFDYISLITRGVDGRYRRVGSEPALFEPAGAVSSLAPENIANVLASGETIAQFRSDRRDGQRARRLAEAGYTRVLASVLTDVAEPVGLLTIARRENLPFSNDEQRFVELVTLLVAHAVAVERRGP